MTPPVIPAKAGIQEQQAFLDPGLRRGDDDEEFLRGRQIWSENQQRVSVKVIPAKAGIHLYSASCSDRARTLSK
jgi:hypothetical protein